MNSQDFHKLTHYVMDSPAKPPASLFAGGFDDWKSRARLAHFLAMPELKKKDEAIELFRSVVEADINEDNPEEVEEKVYALQRLASCLRSDKKYEDALHYINLAVELVESTDYLYKYILRGEIWGDRWNILHDMQDVQTAQQEIEDKIEAYGTLPIKHNSYLYYGYRFRAQMYATAMMKAEALEEMRKALEYMDIPESYKPRIELAFAAKHDNIAWILNTIDHACPPQEKIHWDI